MATVLETSNKTLAEVMWSNRCETESGRRLAQPVIEKLIQEGTCRLTLEARYGGDVEGPVKWLKVFESLGKVEAAVAWVAWNNALACTFGRFVDRSVRDEVYSDRTLLYANSGRPEGVATITDSGYIVSGRWTLVSGCELAEWFVLRCFVKDASGQPVKDRPPLRFMYIHKSFVNIIDTWTVGGLRGTGSHDIELKDVEVPEIKSFAFEDDSRIDEPMGRVPVCCINSAGCASIALGTALASLDEFIRLGKTKVNDSPAPNFRDHPHIQALLARLATQLTAVRAELHRSVEVLAGLAAENTAPTDEQYASVWAASINAATTSRDTVSEIYAVSGTVAMYTSSPIERAHRDVFAVLQHGMMQPHWLSHAGGVMMGLPPTSPIFRI